MNDILKTYMERFRENRHTLRRYTAFVLALAMITTLFVNWQLHGVGISMTAQYQCGEEEHIHTADCYTKVLTCGYEEGELENADEVAAAAATSQPTVESEPAPLSLEPQIEFVPHEHTEDCYTEVQTLTCMEEEHVHDDDCFDPEDGTLICEKFEHTHDENCYTTEYELTCGLEEGELVEQVVEPTQSAALAAMAVAEPVALAPMVDTVEPIYHHHTDACYEEVLTCPLPEHHHTVACLSDTSADLETPEEWQAANAEAVMTGNWAEDLVSVAKTQLGYEQSEKNFEIDPADGVTLRYYSRYGQSYGNPYGEWDVMFLSYCLKYAGIPQSAIPQEASVLALRSSMSDMDWLLDNEDGSAADVGDIVIYNKYVTRTVAVDSSADGAADGLDDLFSVDTEFENSAELEGSGVSALDAAPSADDSTGTQDTVLTPDPVDPQPEQPVEKPVDSADTAAPSTVTSVSGADTLAPSVVSPAAEPQTTTVTDALPVETVGIVSSVDKDADTLTVISGDVDGKVAEVTLFNTDVENVISVAYAQIELSEGDSDSDDDTASDIIETDPVFSCSVTTVYETASASAVRPSRSRAARYAAPSTYAVTAVSATPVDMGTHITNVSVQVPNSTDGSGVVTSWKDANGIVRPGQTVKVQLNYSFNENEITADNRVATYKLPNGITLLDSVSDSGNITWRDSTGKDVVVGTYNIVGDTVTFTYNETFADGKAFDGDFEFKASASSDSSMENQKINFGGTTGSVTIKKEDLISDLSLSKNVQKDASGKELIKYDSTAKTLDIAYEVVAKTTNGTGDTVNLTDFFDTVNSSLPSNATYRQDTIKLIKIAADGTEKDVTTDYQSKLTVGTELKYDALPELKAGEQYVLRYHATIPVNDDYTYKAINKVKAEFDGKDSSTSKEVKNTEPRLTKSGNYDANSRIITWTVTIKNPYGEDLRGKKFTDLLPAGLEVVNNVEITRGYWSDDIKPVSAEDFKKAGCSYTFPTDKSETAAFYTIKIQTKVPDGTAVGTTYTNTADFDGNSASGEVTVTDRSSYLSKSLSTAEDLETGKKKLTWQTSVSIPTGWNKITLTDTIHDAEVEGIEQDGTHYAVLSELRDEIKANLYLTLFNSSETVTMANASEHHVTFTVTYYDEHGNTITNNDAHVAKFTITANLADGQTLDATSMVLSSYHTVADISNAGIEEPWLFVNNAASGDKTSDASYTYKKPKEAKLEKLVYEYGNFNNAGSKISELDYTSNGGKIYYELTIPTSLTCKDPLTTKDLVITDTLPAGVTFDISSVTVGANEYKADGSVNHQAWFANTIYGSGGRSNYDISATKNFSASKTHIGATDTDRTITFTINSGYNVSDKPQVFYIRYSVSVAEDASWDDLRTENKYRNSAEWNGDKAETETTVKRSYEKLYKTGTIVTEDPDASGKPTATKKINYSVVINPTGDKLLTTSNTLTLTDTLSFEPSDNTSADLDLSSIHLYGVTLDTTTGNLVADHTNEIGHDRFTATYDSPNHTMTVTVPDELACVLEYTYQISYPSSTEVTVKNHANLSGLVEKWVDTHVVNYDSSATVRFSKFDLNKVDSNDYLVTLPGATFQLAKWNKTTGTFEEVCTLKTNSSGQINFGLLDSSATAETTDTSSAQLLCSTLYRIVETDAPTGYALSKSPIYLLWGAFSNTKRADAFNAATGESSIHDASEYDKWLDCNNVTYLARGDISAVYVPNTANSITVAKHWLDTDGTTELALDKVNSTYTATVELRRKSYQYGSQKSDDLVKTVTLDNSNNWSYSWNNLPLTDPADSSITYKYYVKETACSGTFKYDLNNTGITGGTILLYNQVPEDANYELPSTGGSGTLPYTAVGGTMMLSALAYSFIHRKRRREGRADD
ncbi:MAG: SpaA isopeptide-forming pilin-related protein [Faecalibacterium prausnitzii]